MVSGRGREPSLVIIDDSHVRRCEKDTGNTYVRL